ncbi:hypothetical protein BZA77DRAFT_3752 [Pyronema omphalodes]|nr:hypothetical protein BZA77DRAFT_3752 [Pyronema omphalodes]
MENLPAEIFNELLDQLEPGGRDVPTSDSHRNPWARPQPCKPDHIDSRHHYASLRLVCKRFDNFAAPYLFRSIGLRFNAKSFNRLASLAGNPVLARHVKKFVYLMPYIYEEGTQDFDAFRNDETLGLSNKIRQIMFEEQGPYYYTSVYKEQQHLMRDSYDLNVLRKAMRAFTSLQEVHLLAIMMHKDIVLRNLASSFDNWEFIDCKWIPACTHAVETLLTALHDAKSPVTVLRSPTLSPISMMLLSPKTKHISPKVWNQLTFLEITFDERPDRSYLDTSGTMLIGQDDRLAKMFKQFFESAENLTALYVRFTPGMPVRLPLNHVFHSVHWPKLRILGIGSWMLHAEELIDIATRHKETLTGIRLSEIYLLDGDLWKDVVVSLKENIKNLEWIGLHDISYEREYVRKQAFIETYSDTSSEYNFDDSDPEMDGMSLRSRGSNSSTTASQGPLSLIDEGGEDVVYGNVFTTTSATGQGGPAFVTIRELPFGIHSKNGIIHDAEEELEDNGRTVTSAQRKHWERWIMGKTADGEPYSRPL